MRRLLIRGLMRLVPGTLFGRLALLLGVAVLVSHFLALTLMFKLGPDIFGPPRVGQAPSAFASMPSDRRPPPPGAPGGAPSFSLWRLWVDVGVRLSALLLAAWVGARWLSQPVLRMASAARELGHDIHRPALVESGTVECREAIRVFNKMQAQICLQLSDRDRFVAAVSHDLRTPLTRMALRAESVLDADQRQQFGRDIAEMNSMITDTLDYLRGVAAAEPLVLLDLVSMLQSMADDAAACGQAVAFVPDVPLQAEPLLRTQAQALRRCIANIVDNAVRYGGMARIRCFEQNDEIFIEVSDQGPGLTQADLAKVMAPFYRVEGSRNRHGGGVGLGLSIANDIARRLRGAVRLENGRSGGLIATVVLPKRADWVVDDSGGKRSS